MRLSCFFQLKPIVRWIYRRAKNRIPYIPYQSLLLSTIVLNDISIYRNRSYFHGTNISRIHNLDSIHDYIFTDPYQGKAIYSRK